MNTISTISLLYWVGIELSFGHSPSVSLILNQERHWNTLSCPHVISYDLNHSPDNQVTFTCHLTGNRPKKVSFYLYHVTLFMLYNKRNMDRCASMDQCFSIKMEQASSNTLSVTVQSLRPCFSGRVSFRYELRQTNNLISNGIMDVLLFHRLKTPTKMVPTRTMNTTDVGIVLSGSIRSNCHYNINALLYTMTYQLIGEPECSTRNISKCTVWKVDRNMYVISCPIYIPCKESLICSAMVKAKVFEKSQVGNSPGAKSRQFSKSLAFISSRSISPNVTGYTLYSITITFLTPVTCVKAHHHFQYNVEYKTSIEKNWTGFRGQVCNLKMENCQIYIAGLKMNTAYTVCISYRNIFDIDAQYGEPVCRNASTAQLPCQPPIVKKITPVEVDATHWKAIIHWLYIGEDCWNDDFATNSTNHHYLIEIKDGNSTATPKSYMMSSSANSSSSGIIKLEYQRKYILTMSSCNFFGCLNGQKIDISVQSVKQKQPEASTTDMKQKMTETVLICVMSLLFLVASSFLYFILKKRKQFQRLRMKRKLKAADIKILRENCNQQFELTTNVSRRGFETDHDIRQKEFQEKKRVVMVDTRPLMSRKISFSNHFEIPENSSLV